MKHEPKATAHAAAVVTAVVYVVCALLAVVTPDLFMTIGKSWFHGIDISRISVTNITPGSFLLGIITASLSAWVVGYLFARSYNYFLKKK